MRTTFALDLKVLRRKSGLTQKDCAHLLAIHPSRISLLESGRVIPTITDIIALATLYGRSIEQLLPQLVRDTHHHLAERLRSMPKAPARWLGRFNRQHTLDDLADRLAALTDYGYGTA
jgi:transcriptional regulator with XRE-family HTH domain